MTIQTPEKMLTHRPLFERETPVGDVLQFVIMNDDRCAIIRDGQPIHVCQSDEQSIELAVAEYMRMTRSTIQHSAA